MHPPAHINYMNIVIISILLLGGVALSFQEWQHNKADIVDGISATGDAISGIVPSSQVHEAMPQLEVNTVSNSMTIASGASLLTLALIMVAAATIIGFIGCFRFYAGC